MSSFYARVELWRGGKNTHSWGKAARPKDRRSAGMRLTGGGYEIEETFLREKRVFQPSKIELQDPSHRVDVVVTLVIHQGVFTCTHVHVARSASQLTWPSILHFCSNGLMCLCIRRKRLARPLTCDTWALYVHWKCAVGQAVSPKVDKSNLKSIKSRRQSTNLFQMHF